MTSTRQVDVAAQAAARTVTGVVAALIAWAVTDNLGWAVVALFATGFVLNRFTRPR